jgi:hypothetical protein
MMGWGSFWAQAVLGIVSTVVLFFSSVFLTAQPVMTNLPNTPGGQAVRAADPGFGLGMVLTTCGLVALYIGIFWAFRYTRLSRKLQASDGRARPKRGDTIKIIRNGLIISLTGMLFTLLGTFAIVGSLVGKSFQQGVSSVWGGLPANFIQGADIFTVQGALIVLLAHFIALSSSLWLLRTMNRQ